MKRAILLAVVVLCVWPAAARAGKDATQTPDVPDEYASTDPRFQQADAVLNKARVATSNPDGAGGRITGLRRVLKKWPDYPYLPWVHYYLGVNYQLLGEYDKAVPAFEEALRGNAMLANKTPIKAYLEQARQKQFVTYASAGLIGVLALVGLLSVWTLARRGQAVRWRRLLILFGSATVLWGATVFLLPRILGRPEAGLDAYPKPTLACYQMGQLGDRLLWILLGYGVGAILAAMVVMAAVSGLRRWAKLLVGLTGTLVVTLALTGLFVVRYCYHRSRYESLGARIFFMVKDIATKEEVPDEMLPLYEESFRNRILASRKKGAAPPPATRENHEEGMHEDQD